ncbi:MAG: four helix bundle protein [Acidobacteriota bacterium]
MSKYQDLLVWQKSMYSVEDVYAVVRQLPKYETYALIHQLRRAAVSVPSNIAEGQNRGSVNEVVQFSGVALGSLAEVETQLEIVRRIYDIDTLNTQNSVREISRMLVGLIKSLLSKM